MNDNNTWFPDSSATNHVTSAFSHLNVGSIYHGNSKLQMGNGAGMNRVLESLQQKFPDVSKSQLGNKVREISDYSFLKNRWKVKKDILIKLGLPVSPGDRSGLSAFPDKEKLGLILRKRDVDLPSSVTDHVIEEKKGFVVGGQLKNKDKGDGDQITRNFGVVDREKKCGIRESKEKAMNPSSSNVNVDFEIRSCLDCGEACKESVRLSLSEASSKMGLFSNLHLLSGEYGGFANGPGGNR
ncbi:hypothetical protein EZV62_006633 [Acer yangbiense]|uniref:Chromatin assembly factor 1 subunit Cac1-like C-terminal domain-containing protein n=1 Tax=Acer yangbiense TaxID=1000413 RepID=A0A5C7I8G0_9ROSI|nr:hypothetical protein EZV62_006633 [Acer yangbiense]